MNICNMSSRDKSDAEKRGGECWGRRPEGGAKVGPVDVQKRSTQQKESQCKCLGPGVDMVYIELEGSEKRLEREVGLQM